MSEQRSVGVHFGALAPSLAEQLAGQGLEAHAEDLERLQGDADAITRLYLRGLLTDSQKQAAHRKLMKAITTVAVPRRDEGAAAAHTEGDHPTPGPTGEVS